VSTDTTPSPWPRWLGHAAIGLFLLGIAGRLLRYALCFPIWCDEAFIGLSLLDRDYLGLTRQLECRQVAPLFFLWVQRAALELLGTSEYALRLVPLLAGLGGLALFWRLARDTLSPLAAVFALGLLAVARWPVTMSANLKPYSLDLFVALGLLVPAVRYLHRPEEIRWLLLLALLVPVALFASYPSVFIAGGVALALVPAALRTGWNARGVFALYGLLLIAGFLAAYLIVGRQQLDPEHGVVQRDMQDYWQRGFPPGELLPFFRWLLWAHTSWLVAYPLGGDRGASILTALACAVGIWCLGRGRRWGVLALLLTPFALGIVAAALHRYPYGAATRLAQHLAPAVCLLAGTGLATLVECLKSEGLRFRAICATCGLLAAIGVGGMVADVSRPYRDADALWARQLTREVLAHAGPGDRFVILDDRAAVRPLLRWHLSQLRPNLTWGSCRDGAEGAEAVWTIKTWSVEEPLPAEQRRAAALAAGPAGWVAAEHASYALPAYKTDPFHYAEVIRWVRPNGALARRGTLAAWP
jgi:hypothetical protein